MGGLQAQMSHDSNTNTPSGTDTRDDAESVELNENDSIETILSAMSKSPRLASVQEKASRLLGRLSQYRTNNPKRREIGSAGGIARIVDGMKLHPQDEMVQKHGCFALRWLVFRNDDNRRRVAKAGGVEAVVQAMNDHPSDEPLLEHACIVLTDLSVHTDEKNRHDSWERTTLIGRHGGVEAVTDVMQRHPTAVILLKNACKALKNLSEANDDNRKRIAQAGGIETVVRVMNENPTAELLVEHACIVLAHLSWHNDQQNHEASNERRCLIGESGGVEAILGAMQQHPTAAVLLKYACWALQNLCVGNNDDNKQRIAQAGGVQAVVQAMNGHPSAELLVEHACTALTYLCLTNTKTDDKTSADRRVLLVQAGGIETILNALQCHPTAAVLLKYACWALHILCADNDDNRKLVAQSGGVQAVVKAMKEHSSDKPLLDHCCILLAQLSTHVDKQNSEESAGRRVLIGQAGGVEAVIHAFERHPSGAVLGKHPCTALQSLCVANDDNRRRLAQVGGVETLLKGMNDNPSNVALLINACMLLTFLSSHHEDKYRKMAESREALIGQAGGVEVIARAMLQHPTSALLVQYACCTLKNLCRASEDNRDRVAQAGGIQAVVTGVNQHASDQTLSQQACILVRYLCTQLDQHNKESADSTERRELIEQAGGVQAITNVLRQQPTVAVVVKCACWTLRFLTSASDDNRKRVAETGGAQAVVNAMKEHPSDQLVLELTCNVLTHLSSHIDTEHLKESTERTALIGEAGGVEAITKAMERHPTSVVLLKYACNALTDLSDGNDDNRRRVVQAGGVEAVVKAMKKHTSEALLLEHACAAILCLSAPQNEKSHTEANQRSSFIGKTGAVEAIIRAMQHHPTAGLLLNYACGALENLCMSNDDNRRCVARAGGVQAVVKAMNEHVSDESLLEHACILLAYLSTHIDEQNAKDSEGRRALIGETGGVEAVINALQRHPTAAVLARHSCKALGNFCLTNDLNRKRIAQAGGVEEVVKTMNKHASVELVLQHACILLSHLSLHQDKKQRTESEGRRALIGQAGGVAAVTNAMGRHPTVVVLLKYVCMALTTLTYFNDDNRMVVAREGGIEVIIDMMQRYPSVKDLLEQACRTLGNLSVNDDNRKRIGRAGGIEVVVETMQRHSTDTKIQDEATRALFKLSFNGDNKKLISKTARKAVKEAQKLFPSLKYPTSLLRRLGRRPC